MENRDITTAIELGARCRRFRNALGLSQQTLGDMVGMTGAAISKYEKEGLYNIEIIQELSKALGHDLMTDEIDEEGEVGEIGFEILKEIVSPYSGMQGVIDSEKIVSGKNDIFYGLSKDRLVKELFKLERIGLCVREQYIDFCDKEQDKIFITAKGVIAFKHIASENLCEEIENESINTYERVCQGYSNYQEYIDSNSAERKIRNIRALTGFRIGFVGYLSENHTSSLGIYDYQGVMITRFVDCKNIFTTIMQSMILGLTNDDINLLEEAKDVRSDFYGAGLIIVDEICDEVEYDFLQYVDVCASTSWK